MKLYIVVVFRRQHETNVTVHEGFSIEHKSDIKGCADPVTGSDSH